MGERARQMTRSRPPRAMLLTPGTKRMISAWEAAEVEIRYQDKDAVRVVRVLREGDMLRVTVDGRIYTVQAHQPEAGRLHLELQPGGERWLAYVARQDETVQVALGANVTVLHIAQSEFSRHKTREDGGSLEAAMPGQVVAILVKIGDHVQTGQPLIMLEAMKMELRLIAPQAGRVTAIYCEEKQVVARGQKLVQIT